MKKTNQSLKKASEEFIRSVLEKNFHQKVQPDQLDQAAEKLSKAIPQLEKQAA